MAEEKSLEQQITEQTDIDEDDKSMLRNYFGVDKGSNVHSFLNKVVETNDTTKLGVLSDQELGTIGNPLRSFKFMSLFADQIMDEPELSDFFIKEGEIITATSLSRKGTLLNLAVVQRKELADVTKKDMGEKQKKNWFKKKDESVLES